MYQEFFGFTDRPFKSVPAAKQYVPCQAIEHARQTVLRGIERGDGPALVVGPAGSGKSLLAQVVADQLGAKYHVALLNSARLDSCRALLQSILFEMHLPYRELEEGEMRLSLIDFLRTEEATPGLLLLVDEAHTLPLRLLEEIRLITNIADQGNPRVRLVLLGGAQLEERFASPKLEAFNQRVASRSYLQALNYDETTYYVREQVKLVGGQGRQLFSDATANAIYRATDGIPRLVNQICDHALMLTFLGGGKTVTAESVEEAWADLQQLPAPWQAPREDHIQQRAKPVVENVLEFGTLDDDFPVSTSKFSASDYQQLEQRLDHVGDAVQSYDACGFSSEALDLDEPTGPAIELQFPVSAGRVQGGPTEVTLEIKVPVDLFGTFDDEEAVPDHYAQLDAAAAAKPHLPRRLPDFTAQIQESQSTVESFSYLSSQTGYADLAPSVVSSDWNQAAFDCGGLGNIDLPIARFIAMIDAIDLSLELENIQPLPPPEAAVEPEQPPAAKGFTVVHQADERDFDPADDPVTPEQINIEAPTSDRHGSDDRDLLCIEGLRETYHRNSAPNRSKYRQLFSNLRRREGTG